MPSMLQNCTGSLSIPNPKHTLNLLSDVRAAPNILAGLNSKGEDKMNVGIYGTLGPAGFSTTIFAASHKTQIPNDRSLPTSTLLGVSNCEGRCT